MDLGRPSPHKGSATEVSFYNKPPLRQALDDLVYSAQALDEGV